MRPAFIDAMSWEMAEVYGAVTDQILINLAHYFPYYDARNFPRSSITYQADMLAQMGQVNKETMAIIRRNLVGVDKYLNAALEQVIVDSVQAVNPELWKAVKKGIFMPPQAPVVSPNQYRAFNLYYTQAANKLNLVNTIMLESTQQAYRATVADIAARVQATQTALDIGAGEVVTGVSSWNTATAHAIKRLQQNGITGFIDHGGHRWSAESYVAMDIRTTMFNTGRAAVWETNQNFGNDLYQVSYHNGARPLCYPWQSKVISSTDNARTVTDLDGNEIQVYAQSQTSYGEPAGLFGINCKHYPTPFIPGVSLVREGGQSEEENAKTYAESQQQRGLERKIREEKRDLLMLKEQGAPDELIKAQRAKIRQTDDDIDAFCDATGRARRQNREAVYTRREFPSSKTYDVSLFEQQQKEMIEGFYSVGGAQVEFSNTPGMTPNVPLVPKPRTETVVQNEEVQPKATNRLVTEVLPKTGIQPLAVERLEKDRTTDEIIAVLGGGDRTKGSCSSLAYAYAGQRAGYNVIDFRGGESQQFFSSNWLRITKFDGVDGEIAKSYNDFVGAHLLLNRVEIGKEYYFSTGRHAAIVRRTADNTLQYLEMQSSDRNGWFKLDDRALKNRFAAKKQHTTYGEKYECSSTLVDIEKLGKSPDFIEMLKYINTEASKQKKGVAGGIK